VVAARVSVLGWYSQGYDRHMEDVQLVHLRLNRTPASPGGTDSWGYKVDVYEAVYTGAEPVTLDIEVSDSTRTSLPVSDPAMMILVRDAIRSVVDNRVERFAEPAIEQIRSWPQPIVLSRDHFPDNL
jgi:hypothetical protein